MKIKDLSVFFPCVNEAENIENTVNRAVKILENLNLNYEVIVINDGSKDNTESVIKKLEKENSRIRLITHPINLGYGEALKSGFYSAKYDTICYTDGDGQFDFSEVTKFLDKIEDSDVVVGYRIKRKDPFFRILFAKGWALALFIFFRLGLKDVDCGFKMVKKRVIEKIEHLQSQRGAMINAELVIKAKKAGFNITQVGVNHYPRLAGKPTGANIKVIVKSFLDLFKLWWRVKKEKNIFLALILILVFATFLRLIRVPEYMTFLGDEGRDVLIVKEMVDIWHFPLIGPPMSVGNIYLGPLYYYMMFIAMAPFGLNPVAAVVMNGFIGVFTVGLVYLLARLLYSKKAGLISAFLYAISPVTILYSRTSWNPNPAPFFSLIAMISLYLIHKSGNFNWLLLTGLAIGAALQMHYLSLLLIPIAILICAYELFYRKNKKLVTFNFIKGVLIGISGFILVMSPLIIFDLRHDFMNFKAAQEIFTSKETIGVSIFDNLSKIPEIYNFNLIGRYLAGENTMLIYIVSILLISGLFIRKNWSSVFMGIWLFVGLAGLSFYRNNIFDHYLNFLNPAPFILLGWVYGFGFKSRLLNYLGKISLSILLVFLTISNIQKNPLMFSPGNQLKKTQDVAKYIISKTEDKDFNFALISKNNYDAAYQFFLDMYGYKPKKVPMNITDQLFVVCEDPICDPTHNSKYEVVAFGWSKIAWEENLYGVKIYKLEHNPSGKP